MSITVRDCLSLPSLSSGKVVAGERGLDSIVTSVSVLEFDDYEDNFYIPNEIIITSFYCAKNNVDEQCKIIRHCKNNGDVALILFYSDVILKGIDNKLIQTADENNFPIIVLKGNDMGLVYSDVIADIMEAIITDRQLGKDLEIKFKDGYSWEKNIITYVLDNGFDEKDKFAKKIALSASEFNSMLIISTKHNSSVFTLEQCAIVKKYLNKVGISHIADVKDGNIVVMLRHTKFSREKNNTVNDSIDKSWLNEHIKIIYKIFEAVVDTVIFLFDNINDIKDFSHNYRLVSESKKALFTIFPQKNLIFPPHLRFSLQCKDLLYNYIPITTILDPMISNDHYEIIETLATFMLDADFEVKRAAEIMYVHRNTILYRIKKANILLDQDISSWPFCHELYSAIAVWRLKNNI
jgi:transcriptional regulator, pucR family